MTGAQKTTSGCLLPAFATSNICAAVLFLVMNSIRGVIEGAAVTPVFQPLVDLRSGLTVGYEALARGPKGSKLERPDLLFAAARAAGRLSEFDWVCRTAAVKGALRGQLRPPFTLFINSEPETIGSKMPADFAEWWGRARLAGLHLVFEITERAVMERPAELLQATDFIREFGWGVALDDVGTNPESLALLPFLKPDVIKLDMSLVHGTATDAGEVVLALNAETERSGTVLLAEGIETGDHLEMARMMGATTGQGWLFGRPEALPDPLPEAGPTIAITKRQGRPDPSETPYRIVASKVRPRRVTRDHLVGASRLIERRAAAMPHPPLMFATFQHARNYTSGTSDVYQGLASDLPFIAVMAEGWSNEASSPRRVGLAADDPLTEEWCVGFISPFSAMLMTARERDEGIDERSFDVSMTFNRDLAIGAVDCLLRRLVSPEETALHARTDVDFAAAVTEVLAMAGQEEDIARPLLEMMSEMTGLQSTFLSRVHDEARYDVVVSYNQGKLEVDEGLSMPWTEAICHDALSVGRQAFDDVQEDLPDNLAAREMGFRTFVTCPVVIEDGKVIGTLCGASDRVVPLSEQQIDMVRRFAQLVARRVGSTK